IIAEGGDGKPDYNVASDLFRRAAQFGIRDSQYNIAILLARGLGVGQSMKDAYMWFSVAAAQGDEEAARKRDEVGGRLSPEDLSAAKAAAASFKPLAQDALANDVPDRIWDTPTLGKPKTSDAKPANRVTGSARI
ncbi:MAG: tetratricopeptide repeat protein, partial [Beijerinckiaceae bacterium]